MRRSPSETARQPHRSNIPNPLLERARAIADGTDFWSRPELRERFAVRVGSGEDPLGDNYLVTRSPEERRSIGATFTPARIVKAMLEWARLEAGSSGMPLRVIDGGAGTGRFAIGAARTFPRAEIIAVETDPDLLVLLKANLRITGFADRVRVIADDFRSIQLPPLSGPSLFIGNPPYVRHHQISKEWKEWYIATLARKGIRASQLAGLHLHFFAKIAEIGRAGDYGCLITAAEWLEVGYGAALRSLLANGLGGTEIHVLQPEAEAFPGTMTTAAIAAFRIGNRPRSLLLRNVQNSAGLDRLEGGRAIDWVEAAREKKWTLLLRKTPAVPAGMIELGELCRVHRGQVTGANNVWIAGPHTPKLPPRFLRPTITRAQELIRAEPSLDHANHLARVIDLPPSLDKLEPDERIAVEWFIQWARSVGAADG
ncbi:MAG: class I SAM-dependent methyltransferase, partial [Alphaproteobacteria bacterium]|nr:class I SAM-dependent methyltransferase [Alphaproteobacteria bacterium]